jgi:hypothetical protein
MPKANIRPELPLSIHDLQKQESESEGQAHSSLNAWRFGPTRARSSTSVLLSPVFESECRLQGRRLKKSISLKPRNGRRFTTMQRRELEARRPRELRYRGYEIRIYGGADGWRVRAKPLTPYQPILRRHSFLVPASREADAVAEAKRLVDALIATMSL